MSNSKLEFTLDAATEKRLEDLLAEMRSAYDRHRAEVIEPVCARYKRMIAGRVGGERVSERSRDASSSSLSDNTLIEMEAATATFRARQRWPIVFAYHRRAYREFGLGGLLWFMESLRRDLDHRLLSAVVLLMMSRLDDPTPGEIVRWIRQLHREGVVVTPTRAKRGRKTLGATAMTSAERQRRHRARKRAK
ncbi:hypothetical protein [Methylorubrum aminovorans]